MSTRTGLLKYSNGQRESIQKEAASLRDEFLRLATQLDNHLINVNIARVIGSFIGVLGEAIAVAGLFILPYTENRSSAAAILGGLAGATGGLISTGSQLTLMAIELFKRRSAVQKWKRFKEDFAEMPEVEPQRLAGDLKGILSQDALLVAEAAKSVALSETMGAFSGTPVDSRAITLDGGTVVVSSVVSMTILWFCLYDLLRASEELRRQDKSKAGNYFRTLANALTEIAQMEHL